MLVASWESDNIDQNNKKKKIIDSRNFLIKSLYLN